jgi:O-antigen/teichoic acid export membrane protein
MGIVIRQSIKSSIVTYAGILIGAFNILWLYPKFLSPEEIGLTRVVIDVALILAALAQFGIPNIADKFFAHYKDEQRKHKGFLLLLIIFPFLGIIIISIVFLFLKPFWIEAYSKHSPLLIDYFYYIIPLAFFMMYENVLESYSRVHYRIVVPAIVREIFLKLTMTAGVIFFFYDFITLKQFVQVITLSYFLAVVLLVFYIRVLKKFYIFSENPFTDRAKIKEIIFYGGFIFLGGAWGLIAAKIDMIMLSSMKDLAITGIYSIAFFIGTVIEIPRRAISQITTPFISQAWKDKDMDMIKSIYVKTSINLLVAGILLFLLVWCNINYIFEIMPNGDEYKIGKYVVLLIGVAKLVDRSTGVNSEIILTSSYYRFNFLVVILNSIFLVTVNYLLIPIYGMMGAALCIVITLVMANIIRSLFIYIKFKIQPFSFKNLWIIIFGAVVLLILTYMPDINIGTFSPYINIAVRSLLILIAFMGPVYYFRISDDINITVIQLVKKLKFSGKQKRF